MQREAFFAAARAGKPGPLCKKTNARCNLDKITQNIFGWNVKKQKIKPQKREKIHAAVRSHTRNDASKKSQKCEKMA